MTIPLKLILLTLILGFSVNAQELTFTYTTKFLPYDKGYQYSPEHVFAIWIEDTDGRFVNTVAMYGYQRANYLETWQSKSGGYTTDAVTGATQSVHQSRSYKWNLKNYRGNVVDNGEYKICFEYTSKDGQGPVYRYPINISDKSETLRPDDEIYLKDISIFYDSGITGVNSNPQQQECFNIVPNPLTANSEIVLFQPYPSDVKFKLISVSGKLLAQKQVAALTGSNSYKLSELFSSIPNGVAFIVAETQTYSLAQKVVNH